MGVSIIDCKHVGAVARLQELCCLHIQEIEVIPKEGSSVNISRIIIERIDINSEVTIA
jgi:hypothetical protein